MPTKQRPTVSIIGAGRMGQALAVAMQKSRYSIEALVARTSRKAETAARLLVPPPLGLAAAELKRLPSTDVVLIATPDDVIVKTAKALAAATGTGNGRVVLHTSGALSSEVLKPLARVGFETGSLHPLVSVSEPMAGAKALHGAYFCVEGTRLAVMAARKIVAALDGHSFTVGIKDKPLYHAAAVMASPHMTALFALAVELLSECGVTKKTAHQILLPLIKSTVENLQTSSTGEALTGTFARGDVATVKRHLAALSGKKHENAREVYRRLGLHSLTIATNLDARVIDEIGKILESAKRNKRFTN